MACNKPGTNINVKVMVKIRPLIEREIDNQEKICWEKVADKEIVELDAPTPTKPCIYDHVFGGVDPTQAIYDMAISHIVDSCVQGFNGSVMAYGQTASGKTYTMMGDERNLGIIRLVAENIFGIVEKHDDRDIYMVRCSFLEIYNEKINDLLDQEKTNLEVFETQDGAVMIKDATEKVVRKATNMIELIEQGNATKRMGETAANDRSSRSHTIFRIMIESQEAHEDGSSIKMGILDLVDLAGSESINKTKASGDRLKEGISINKSLLELGRVIKELSEKKEGEDKFIVYRNSKLTRVIQHSLGGNAKSVVICTVSPAEREETRNTLRFASRAKNIKNTPKLNEILSDQAMIKRLNERINGLRKQIDAMTRNKSSAETRQDIIERIEKCEMQFIRSKKNSRKQERRRQTWHYTPNLMEIKQDSSETEQELLMELMPPPPPIFTTQRGTNSIHSYETFEMPMFNGHVEEFEPGETVNFHQTPSPTPRIQTPTIFKRRLSAIMEGVATPPIGTVIRTCDHCKELEGELKELSDFTKLEQLYHVHEETDRSSCEDFIEHLKTELDEAKQLVDMNNAEITSLKASIRDSSEVVSEAVRTKAEALKAKEIAECHSAGIEYELEALKVRFENREAELLGLLEEKKLERHLELEQAKADMKELKNKHKVLQGEYDETSMQLMEAIQDYDSLKAEVDKEKATEKVSQKEANLQSQLDEATKQIENFKQELNELRSTLEKLVPIVGEKDKLDLLYQDLVQKSSELSGQLAAKDQEIDSLKAKLVETEQSLAQKLAETEDISELKIKLDSLEKEASTAKNALNEKAIENQNLLTKIQVIQTSIETEVAEKDKLWDKLDAEIKNMEELRSELDETKSRLEKTSEELVSVQAGKEQLLTTISGLNEVLTQEAEQLKNEISMSGSESALLITDLKEQIRVLNEKCRDLEQKESENENLRTEVQLIQTSIEREVAEKEQLSQKFETEMKNTEHLRSELDETKSQLEQTVNEVNLVKSSLVEAEGRFEKTSEELVGIQEEKEQLLKTISSLNEQKEGLTQEAEQLKKEISMSGSESSTLITNLKEEIRCLNKKSTEIDVISERLRDTMTQLDVLTQEKATLVRDLEEKESENEDLRTKIQLVETKIETDLAEKDQLSQKLDAEMKNTEEQRSELDETKSRLEKTVNEVNLVKSSLVEAETRLESTSEELLTIQAEKEQLLTTISGLNEERERLTQEAEQLKKEVSMSDSELETLITDLKGEIRDLNEKCRDLEQKSTEIDVMSERLRETETQVDVLTQEKATLEEKSTTLRSELDDLSQKLSKATEERGKSERQLEDQTEKVSTLQQELLETLDMLHEMEAETKEVVKLRADISELQKQIASLSEEKETLVAQQTTYEEASRNYETQIETLKSKQVSLVTELEQLQIFQNQSSVEIATVKDENSKYKTETSDLIMKLATVEEKLALIESKYEQALTELTSSKATITQTTEEVTKMRQSVSLRDQQLHEALTKLKQLEAEREQHTKDMFELDDLRKRTVKDRRSRRQSAHDELRPLVRSIKAIAVQTEPTEESCQCRVLNEKLEKQKIELLKAKVTIDHYRLGNNQKVGDIREEKEKVERKLEETVVEVNKWHQEALRLRKDRETLRQHLVQMNSEMKQLQEKVNRDTSSREIQTELQLPIINMNSDAASLDQKLYIKKLEDDLSQQTKKYLECKKVAQDRREKIREKEAEIASLQNRSPEGGKENASNNIQVSQLMNEVLQLKKENGELVQHYNHYKGLYLTRVPQTSAKKQHSNQTQTELSSDDITTVIRDRELFETKYRKTAQLFNVVKQSLEDYKKSFVIRVSENRALATVLKKIDKRYPGPPPIEGIDEMYQMGYEEWKKQNPDFVKRYQLE